MIISTVVTNTKGHVIIKEPQIKAKFELSGDYSFRVALSYTNKGIALKINYQS